MDGLIKKQIIPKEEEHTLMLDLKTLRYDLQGLASA
jgi:hypothetical protein